MQKKMPMFLYSVVLGLTILLGFIFIILQPSIADYSTSKLKRPHIIFIFADDLGWNDVSFHGSPQIPTPNLDALASSGLILNNYYSECLCTPSRGALMTGKYPIRLGLQHFVLRSGEASGLPLEMTIMPQHLKELGYATHMVGKWHLGYMQKEYTPTFRGFDTFFGVYNGVMDYYDYTHYTKTEIPLSPIFYGIDMHNGTKTVRDFRGQYATHVFTEQAIDIIENHDSSKPLFLYLAPTAPHTGNSYMPLQAPPEIVNRFDHIKNESRRIFAAMVSALDDSVGTVFKSLHKKEMLMDSIFVFVSDNGGDSNDYASNYPLRGRKFDWWEGGVRVPAFIWSPLLQLQEPKVSMQLMHVTDWLPTLYSAAGGNVTNLGDVDGHDMWSSFFADLPSPRGELLHTIEPIQNVSVLRKEDLKLISGNLSYSLNSWSGPTGFEDMPPPDSMDRWVYRHGSTTRDILYKTNLYLPKTPDTWRERSGPIRCSKRESNENICDPTQMPCLFNISADPCENNNIADQYPEIVQSMMNIITFYEKLAVKPQFKDRDLHSDPRCHDFAHVPWLDPEHRSNCPFESTFKTNK